VCTDLESILPLRAKIRASTSLRAACQDGALTRLWVAWPCLYWLWRSDMNICPLDYKYGGRPSLASPHLSYNGLQVGVPTTTLLDIHFCVRIRSRALV
jgi:hypothetical protein